MEMKTLSYLVLMGIVLGTISLLGLPARADYGASTLPDTSVAPSTTLSAPAVPSGTPSVAGLVPFTAEANYMSLPGYLRWQMYASNGSWITYADARGMVQQEVQVASAR